MIGAGLVLGLVVSWSLVLAADNVSNPSNQTVSQFLSAALDPSRYDARVRPSADMGHPDNVTVSLKINSISSVEAIRMDYTVNIFLRQQWRDPRLAHTQFGRDIALSHNLLSNMWVPDLFFANEKEGKFHTVTVPNRLIRVSPDGTVLYSQRISTRLSCEMDLLKYPLDNQTCFMKMESYGYTTKDMVLYWPSVSDPIEEGVIELPEFGVTRISVGDCTAKYDTGSFTCIYAAIEMERQFSYYLIQIYIPSFLIVILSWVSFWIDKNSPPARISLGLLTVLTITTQSTGINTRLPKVSYVKAIDVWMSTCLVFVFGAFLEYSIVNTLSRKPKEEAKPQKGNASKSMVKSEDGKFTINHENFHNEDSEQPDLTPKHCSPCVSDPAKLVDKLARILFPAAFMIFNIFYWLTYRVFLA